MRREVIKKGALVRIITPQPMHKPRIGSIVRVVEEKTYGDHRSEHNVGAIARVQSVGYDHRTQAFDLALVRVDGMRWRSVSGNEYAQEKRFFWASDVQPVDPGIAALYGVDQT